MNRTEKNWEHDSDLVLELLLRQTPARPRPDKKTENAARHVVHAAWRDVTRARTRRHRTLWAAAASVLMILVGTILAPRLDMNSDTNAVAEIRKQFGAVSFAADAGHHMRLAAGTIIQTGTDGGMALRWATGGSLRLGADTRVELVTEDEIYLHAGRLYFDSGSPTQPAIASKADGMEVLAIRTDRGIVNPLGTRYLTAILDSELAVSVREGRVAVTHSGETTSATAGHRLTVSRNGQNVLEVIPIFGEDWHWVETTTPPFESEGRTIFNFLQWVSRETGRSLRFTTGQAESIAKSSAIIGYGDLDMAPSAALPVVMLSTDLLWRIDRGAIVVTDGR